jgi:hypothetical protein
MDDASKEQFDRLNECIKSHEDNQTAQRGYEVGLTSDRDNPGLKKILPNGQQETYLVLSDEERKKGFVMPVYRSYVHLKCGERTSMGLTLCETYARNPEFYGGTFCCACGKHFPLFDLQMLPCRSCDGRGQVGNHFANCPTCNGTGKTQQATRAFVWECGDAFVGEGPEEVQARLAEKTKGAGI